MQSSPCKGCEFGDQDKRNDICMSCKDREDYYLSLGKMTHSVPLESSDMRMEKIMPRGKAYSRQDVQFLKDNLFDMSNRQLAEALGRSEASIQIKLSKLGLSRRMRSSGFKRGLTAAPAAVDASKNPLAQKERFLLDFSDYPELYDRLLEEAKKCYRSPQQQVFFYIDNGINGSKIKVVGPRIELVGKDSDRDIRHSGDAAKID